MSLTKMIPENDIAKLINRVSPSLDEMSSDVREVVKVADGVAKEVSDDIAKALMKHGSSFELKKFMDIFLEPFKDVLKDSMLTYVRKYQRGN